MARRMPAIVFGLSRPYTPRYEAVSREIESLRDASRDRVVAVLPLRSNPFRLSRRAGVLTGHPLLLRASPFLRAGLSTADVLHVLAPLPLPRRLRLLWSHGTMPRVLTVIATGGEAVAVAPSLSAFDHVVAECGPDLDWLRRGGVPAARLSLIHPGAPDSAATPLPPPPFTVLFASWPFERKEAGFRGLDLVSEAARLRPQLRFLVLTRPESAVRPSEFAFPPNVEVDARIHDDLAPVWARVHAVMAPFRPGSKSKSVPNSLVEGMAAGRPAVVTRQTGIASLVREHGAGSVCEARGESLAAALDAVADDRAQFARRAQELARAQFAVSRFRTRYREIYARLAPGLPGRPESEER